MMVGCDNYKCGVSHLCERYLTHKCRDEVKTFPHKKEWKHGDLPLDLCLEQMFIHTDEEFTGRLSRYEGVPGIVRQIEALGNPKYQLLTVEEWEKYKKEYPEIFGARSSVQIDLSSRRTMPHYPHEHD